MPNLGSLNRLAVVASLALGCNFFSHAWAACNQVAPAWSGVTVAAFDTTVGRVRTISPSDRWADQPDDAPAIVCYVDGSIPKAPPNGEPFDRAIVGIYQGGAELLVAGYRDSLPVRRP